MLNEFLTWWARQLLGFLPEALRQKTGQGGDALIAQPEAVAAGQSASRVRLLLRKGKRETELGSFPMDEAGSHMAAAALLALRRVPANVILSMPPGVLLERRVTLPLAAERDPASVLGYEMDRNTPFSAGEVFWSWAIEQRDRARSRLLVRLSLVPKRALDPLLTMLERVGVVPTSLAAAAVQGEPRSIELLRPGAGHARFPWMLPTMAALCGLLALVVVAMPLIMQVLQRRELEADIAAIHPRVAEAEALRRQISTRTQGSNVFEAQRARVGDPLQVLAALTDLLPDDTFLTDFSLHQGKIAVEGQSAAAARLIAALAVDPVIRNPAFAAPVTRVDGGRADQFSIRAEVAP